MSILNINRNLVDNSTVRTVSDHGAQRVLGMKGSLRGYIESGNAYDKRYYTASKNSVDNRRKKDWGVLKKFIVGGVAIAGLVAGFALFKKSGGSLKGCFDKVKGLFTKSGANGQNNGKIKGFFDNIKQKFASKGQNGANSGKVKKFFTDNAKKVGDFFSDLCSKAKKLFKK